MLPGHKTVLLIAGLYFGGAGIAFAQDQPASDVVPPSIEETAEEPAEEAPSPPPPAPPPQPWKGLFFDNNFSYKQDPDHKHLFGEELKDIPFDAFPIEETTISTGGEVRYRYMDEVNRLRPPFGLTTRDTYDLWRWRQYFDVHVSDLFRGYVEGIDASSFGEELPEAGIDVNRWDLLNAFFDLHVADLGDQAVQFRFGRQELLYGSQRLVSPLDWANTRRNFEGFKLFTKGDVWDIDAWSTRPVNTAAGNTTLARLDNSYDTNDASRTFSGVYATHHGDPQSTYDMYWLFDRDVDLPTTHLHRNRHTVGGRWLKHKPIKDESGDVSRTWHTEAEGGYQFGTDSGQRVEAGFITLGGGHTWNQLPWSPEVWMFYDWASGDHDPADDESNTFQHLFPLAHAYMGLIDNVARQNISDINARVQLKPTKKLQLQGAYHFIDLATDNDFIYTVTGSPAGTTNVGNKVGDELDLLANYDVNTNVSVQVAYFWFWYGSAVQNSALDRDDAKQFYVQTTLRY
ncbi:MAG: alginate export family protein [Planctomycetaceae bacterium]